MNHSLEPRGEGWGGEVPNLDQLIATELVPEGRPPTPIKLLISNFEGVCSPDLPRRVKRVEKLQSFERRLGQLEADHQTILETFSGNLFREADGWYITRDKLARRLAKILKSELVVLKRVGSPEKVEHLYNILKSSIVFSKLMDHSLVRPIFLKLHRLSQGIGLPITTEIDEFTPIDQIQDSDDDDNDGGENRLVRPKIQH